MVYKPTYIWGAPSCMENGSFPKNGWVSHFYPSFYQISQVFRGSVVVPIPKSMALFLMKIPISRDESIIFRAHHILNCIKY